MSRPILPTPKLNAEESELFIQDVLENENRKIVIDIKARAKIVEKNLILSEGGDAK
jgi:hypothetical protein